jgi:acetyl esterase/lipase
MTNIHPQLQEIAQKTPKFNFSKRNRWFMNLIFSFMRTPKPPADVRVENITIHHPQNKTKLRLRVYKPATSATPTPILLWLHGGGYVIGRPEMDDATCAQFVQALGLQIISVDYRLAPKHPFPAGLEDSYLALTWVVSQAQQLGIDPARIAIGGQSAGAGLAAALAQLAHDRQEVQPIFQLLSYPMLDDRTTQRTDLDDSNHVAWTQASNRYGWEAYLGQPGGAAALPAYAAPARREDLSGLPPAWIGVGTLDLFHDEDVAYAQRLQAAGVPCELVVVPGAFHGFDVFDAQLPIAQEFRNSQIAALRQILFP